MSDPHNPHSGHGLRPLGRAMITAYRYELRRGDELVATGHLSRHEPLQDGDRLAVGNHTGIVRSIEPLLGDNERHLVIQLLRDSVH